MDTNYEFFKENLTELVEVYNGKFVVIKNKDVVGAYDSFAEAYVETTKTEKLGNFIIQHCTADALEPKARFAWGNVRFGTVSP